MPPQISRAGGGVALAATDAVLLLPEGDAGTVRVIYQVTVVVSAEFAD